MNRAGFLQAPALPGSSGPCKNYRTSCAEQDLSGQNLARLRQADPLIRAKIGPTLFPDGRGQHPDSAQFPLSDILRRLRPEISDILRRSALTRGPEGRYRQAVASPDPRNERLSDILRRLCPELSDILRFLACTYRTSCAVWQAELSDILRRNYRTSCAVRPRLSDTLRRFTPETIGHLAPNYRTSCAI